MAQVHPPGKEDDALARETEGDGLFPHGLAVAHQDGAAVERFAGGSLPGRVAIRIHEQVGAPGHGYQRAEPGPRDQPGDQLDRAGMDEVGLDPVDGSPQARQQSAGLVQAQRSQDARPVHRLDPGREVD